MKTHSLSIAAVALALLAASTQPAAAQKIWIGNGGNNNWSTGANWLDGVAANATLTDYVFDTANLTGANRTASQLAVASANIGNISFNGTTTSLAVNSQAANTALAPAFLQGNLTVTSGNHTGSAFLQINGTSTWNIAANSSFAKAGGESLGGNGTLIKTGAGLLALNNNFSTANNTWTGTMRVDAGVLRVPNNNAAVGAFGNASATLQLNGGQVRLSQDNNRTYTVGNVIVSASSSIVHTRQSDGVGNSQTFGPLSIGGGSILTFTQDDSGNGVTGFLPTSGSTLVFGATTLTGNGTFNVVNAGANTNVINLTSLNVGAHTADFTGNGTATVAGGLSGSGALSKSGSGILNLSGANTFEGVTTLNAGTLNLGNDAALGAAASVLTINGGTVDVTATRTTTNNNAQNWNGNFAFGGTNTWNTGTGAVTMNGSRTVTVNASTMTVGGAIGDGGSGYSLTKAGAGILALNGANTYTGAAWIQNGSVSVASINTNLGGTGAIRLGDTTTTGALIFTGSSNETVTRNFDLAGTTGGGIITNNSGTNILTINGTISSSGAGSKVLTLNGSSSGLNVVNAVISDNSGSNPTAVAITGGNWNLAGSNSFTGNTTVTGGSVRAGNDNAYGTGTVTFNGGSWAASGTNRTIANNIIYAAANTGSNNNQAVNVTNFTGQSSGSGNLGVNGFENSTVRFSGDNSGWTGSFKFNGPIILQLNHIDAIGSGTTITFNTNAASNVARGTLESQVALTGVNAITQDIDLGGTLAFTGNSTIRTTADMEVTGDVTGGLNGALVKDGAGTLTLGGTNNYSGTTTVSAGTLLINGDSTLATGTVTVSTGATLGGSGTIGGALSVSGTLAPGNSPANLTVNNNITLEDTSTVAFELNGTTVGTQYDRITMTGASSVLALTGINNLTLSLGFTPAINNMFFLVDNQGSSAISGVFEQLNGVTTTLTQGSQFNVGGSVFEISYIGDLGTNSFTGGNDLVILTVVPEPSTIAVLALLVVCLGLHRFRKTRSA